MNLCNIGQDFRYELEKLIRIFLPFEKIVFYNERVMSEKAAVLTRIESADTVTLSTELFLDNKTSKRSEEFKKEHEDYDKFCELTLALQLYDCFCELTGYIAPWGILTGVRPAKLFSRLCVSLGVKGARDYFENKLKVNPYKISLCEETVSKEDQITSLSIGSSFSLYISIPFCPTRCTYCSFVSHSVDKAKGLVEDYVRLLLEEIKETAAIANKLKLRLETIYIGGGTPTTLEAKELNEIMTTVRDNFDLSTLREYTVEAGRPDTITREKLEAIKRGGATRISINPQTMQQSVLDAIGRRHTVEQTIDAFNLARALGFDNINMDLIAGLPLDTREGFQDTLSQVLSLNPESVTVHALAMKRASTLSALGETPEIEAGKTASDMVNHARLRLTESGILPYYMYRQSKTVGNLENVGYAKEGYECLYNVYIMDETHTILACGASAVTKLREPSGSFITRIFNFKYPYEYINRSQEIIERKKGICEFYEKYPTGH